jgi:hypothetical protein
MTTDLSNKVLCVNLKTSCLGVSFVDGYLTEALEVKTGAKPGKTKGSKKILGDGIKPIRSLLRTLRNYVKEQTLPGISEDLRIVTPTILQQIRAEVTKTEEAIANEVARFSDQVAWVNPVTGETSILSRWESLIKQDEIDLDKAFDPTDYPPLENLSASFTVRLTTCDLPSGDYFRVEGLTEEAVAKLKKEHADTMERVKTAAKNEVHKKLAELIGRIAENLDQPDIKRLHDTTFTNLHDYLAKVPDLNITNDPALEAIRVEALSKLNYTMTQVKASETLKEQAAEAAKELAAKLGGGKRRILTAPAAQSPAVEPTSAPSTTDVAA